MDGDPMMENPDAMMEGPGAPGIEDDKQPLM